MINRTAIQQWSEHAPWIDNAQIEQDLIICRALVDIFSDEFLATQLAFRGGTALHKLYLSPQPRYSEDIDMVQITPGPIKPIMYRLGEVLDWLPDRVTKQKRYNNTMLFRVESEIPPTVQIRLKVEINCFEHFNVLGLTIISKNSWEPNFVPFISARKAVTSLTFISLYSARMWMLIKSFSVTRNIWSLWLTRLHLTSSLSITCRRRWKIQSLPMICNPSCAQAYRLVQVMLILSSTRHLLIRWRGRESNEVTV